MSAPPARGPLAAAALRPADEPEGPAVRLLYVDLELAERADLRRALGDRAPSLADGDEALLLAAYRRWGPDVVDRLGGAFAFAVWDGARRAVVAARDPVGLRPLLYASVGGTVVVGGDVRAVLAAGPVPDDLDDDVMATVLLIKRFEPGAHGRTCFRHVASLPGGHRLIAGGRSAQTDRFWRPEDAPALPLRRIEEVGEAVRALLREVVAEAVAGEAVVGTHLSSGIDSTTVAAFAAEACREAGRPAPRAFSWQPPPGPAPSPEHERIAAAAARWALPVTYCPPTAADAIAAAFLDAATDPVTLWAYEAPVRRAAQAAGVGVVLSGWGGDEAISFGGRGTAGPHLARTGRWGALAAFALHDPAWALRRARPRRRRAPLVEESPAARRAAVLRGEAQSFAWPDLLRRAHLPAPERVPTTPPALMAWLLTRGHLGGRAADWARAGAPYGLRYRFPLLDRRVLALALGLPPELWLSWRRRARWPLRAAGEGLVPDVVRLGPKDEPVWGAATGRAARPVLAAVTPYVTPEAAGPRADYIDVARLRAALDARLRGDGPRRPRRRLNEGFDAWSYLALQGIPDALRCPPHSAWRPARTDGQKEPTLE